MKRSTIVCCLFLLSAAACGARGAEEAGVASSSPRIVNIINFIRQCEPRIKFNETSISISGAGGMKDNWFFESPRAKKAELPFTKVESRKLSCTYRGAPYAVSAKQGSFTASGGSALRITPDRNRIVLDLSAR